jgi:hypothetical protein
MEASYTLYADGKKAMILQRNGQSVCVVEIHQDKSKRVSSLDIRPCGRKNAAPARNIPLTAFRIGNKALSDCKKLFVLNKPPSQAPDTYLEPNIVSTAPVRQNA